MRLSPGTVLARRYQLTASLGEGGMGEVWAARHVLTGKAVAVKLLIHAAHERGFREARARFALEARSACAVEHPNVVEIFDFVDSDEPAPFIVMELLQGETLAARLARGPLESAREACRLLLPVVSAVGTAHERGIVHRDLKPSNIFLGARPGEADRPKVKVLDFGIAKWFAGDEPGLRTRTGSTLGTPSYMAPEQATGDRSADHRVDVWSLGVILYEAISGVRPLEGENAAQLVMRLLSTGIMPIEQLAPEIEPELGALIGRMLSRDVARRPADLREPFEVLRRLAGEESVGFGAPGTLGVSLAQPVAEAPDARAGASAPPRTRTSVDALAATEPPAPSSASGRSAGMAGPPASGTPAALAIDASASPPTHASFETTALSMGIAPASRRRVWVLGALAAVSIATLGATAMLTRGPEATAQTADAPLLTRGGAPLAPGLESGDTPPAPVRATAPAATAPAVVLPAVDAPPAPERQAASISTPPPSARRARTHHVSRRAPAPAANPTPPPAPIRNKPKGIECESSAECRSKLCVAYICQ